MPTRWARSSSAARRRVFGIVGEAVDEHAPQRPDLGCRKPGAVGPAHDLHELGDLLREGFVVGLAPIYRFLASTPLGSNTVWLAFPYVVLVGITVGWFLFG